MSLSKEDVLEIHARVLAHARVHKDSKGGSNEDPERVAFDGTRSDVHAALQVLDPIQPGAPGEDPEVVHAKQKAHGKKLWKLADSLVAAAGISEKGAR